jgi:hypothetical protein
LDPRPSGGKGYTVPKTNPFVGQDGARPEIWAYGLRNPWRFSFDKTTRDLWIGDVGQYVIEEIDVILLRRSKGAISAGSGSKAGVPSVAPRRRGRSRRSTSTATARAAAR